MGVLGLVVMTVSFPFFREFSCTEALLRLKYVTISKVIYVDVNM